MDPTSLSQFAPAYDEKTLLYFKSRLEMDYQITNAKKNDNQAPVFLEESKGFEGRTGERGRFIEGKYRENGKTEDHLADLEAALQRLDKGIYGWCLGPRCSDKIPKPRLDAIPEAKYCVSCHAKKVEKEAKRK